MANHVNSVCTVKSNEAGIARFQEIMSRLELDQSDDYEKSLGYIFFDDVDEFTNDRMIDSIGAKWAYVVDYNDVSEGTFSVYSAWNYPETFFEFLSERISEVDPNAKLYVNYSDEMPNFVGVSIFYQGILNDGLCIDGDEFDEYIRANDVEIEAQYDKDANEYSDLGYEYLSECKWDYVSQWQQESMAEIADDDDYK